MPERSGRVHRDEVVADYRNPKSHTGERVVIVGAGNSAVQVGYELDEVATVTLATRYPVQLIPQLIGRKDVHHWHTTTGYRPDLDYLTPLGPTNTSAASPPLTPAWPT